MQSRSSIGERRRSAARRASVKTSAVVGVTTIPSPGRIQPSVLLAEGLGFEGEQECGVQARVPRRRSDGMGQPEVRLPHLLDEAGPEHEGPIGGQAETPASGGPGLRRHDIGGMDAPRDAVDGAPRDAELIQTACERARHRDDAQARDAIADPEEPVVRSPASPLVRDRRHGDARPRPPGDPGQDQVGRTEVVHQMDVGARGVAENIGEFGHDATSDQLLGQQADQPRVAAASPREDRPPEHRPPHRAHRRRRDVADLDLAPVQGHLLPRRRGRSHGDDRDALDRRGQSGQQRGPEVLVAGRAPMREVDADQDEVAAVDRVGRGRRARSGHRPRIAWEGGRYTRER